MRFIKNLLLEVLLCYSRSMSLMLLSYRKPASLNTGVGLKFGPT